MTPASAASTSTSSSRATPSSARPLEHPQLELASHDGRHAQRRAPRRATGPRAGAAAAPAPPRARAAPDRRRRSVAQHIGLHEPQNLTKEERVAAREHVQPRRRRARGLLAGDSFDVRLDVVDAQAVQRQARAEPGELGEQVRALVRLRLPLAVRADDDDRRLSDRLADEAHQDERSGVGRVQVVEHDHERLRARALDEEARDRVEEPEARGLGVDGPPGAGREPLEVAAQLADGLDPGPVRGRAALLPAAPPRHPAAALTGDPRQLLHQPRLADPGLARQQEDEPAPVMGLVEARDELAELGVPAHEGPGRCAGRGVPSHRHLSVEHREPAVQAADGRDQRSRWKKPRMSSSRRSEASCGAKWLPRS